MLYRENTRVIRLAREAEYLWNGSAGLKLAAIAPWN